MAVCPRVRSSSLAESRRHTWQFVPVILALKEDYKFEASPGFTRPCLQRERGGACVFLTDCQKKKYYCQLEILCLRVYQRARDKDTSWNSPQSINTLLLSLGLLFNDSPRLLVTPITHAICGNVPVLQRAVVATQ